jgi:hypothetical protein
VTEPLEAVPFARSDTSPLLVNAQPAGSAGQGCLNTGNVQKAVELHSETGCRLLRISLVSPGAGRPPLG